MVLLWFRYATITASRCVAIWFCVRYASCSAAFMDQAFFMYPSKIVPKYQIWWYDTTGIRLSTHVDVLHLPCFHTLHMLAIRDCQLDSLCMGTAREPLTGADPMSIFSTSRTFRSPSANPHALVAFSPSTSPPAPVASLSATPPAGFSSRCMVRISMRSFRGGGRGKGWQRRSSEWEVVTRKRILRDA